MWRRLPPATSSVLALMLLAGCGRPAAAPAAISPTTTPPSGACPEVAGLQQAIKDRAATAGAYAQLAGGYMQCWRETADPAYYGKAEPALKAALALEPDNTQALAGMGALAASRH